MLEERIRVHRQPGTGQLAYRECVPKDELRYIMKAGGIPLFGCY